MCIPLRFFLVKYNIEGERSNDANNKELGNGQRGFALLWLKLISKKTMSYKYYNPNPFHRFVGDCTIRAICKLTEQDWDSVYAGTVFEGFLYKNMPSGNSTWGAYLERRGYVQHVIPNAWMRGYTVRQFAEEHPRGRFLLVLDQHVVTVVDGDYYDTVDPGDEIPSYYWTKGE